MKTTQFLTLAATTLALSITGCQQKESTAVEMPVAVTEQPEYFMLRPEVEKAYGYTHAVKIGNEIKISGAVSMDEKGNLTAPGNL